MHGMMKQMPQLAFRLLCLPLLRQKDKAPCELRPSGVGGDLETMTHDQTFTWMCWFEIRGKQEYLEMGFGFIAPAP